MAHLRLLRRFARNRPVIRDKKPSPNRRKLTTDPQLREEVATAIGSRLRGLPSRDFSVNARETAFATATLKAAEASVPQQKRTTLGYGWSGDAKKEVERSRALDVRRRAWMRLGGDKRNSQLRGEVRRASKEVRRVRTATKERVPRRDESLCQE